jgi:predicted aconitase with swiveling domain
MAPGRGRGELLVLEAPLSFWGGVEPASGAIIDVRHPQVGLGVGGRVLALPSGRGSSSSSTVLAECLRLGTGPAALVLLEQDAILALGAIVAHELYGLACPVVRADPADWHRLTTGALAMVAAQADLATIELENPAGESPAEQQPTTPGPGEA